MNESLMSSGGADAGHAQKYAQLKEGLEDAVRRIEINCNNSEKQKVEGEMKAFTELINGRNLEVGDKLPIQKIKNVAAGAVILGALAPEIFAIWIFVRVAVP